MQLLREDNIELRRNVCSALKHDKCDCGERALTYPQLRVAAGIKTMCPESHILSNFEDIVDFKHWYFGHFHIDAQLSDKYTALMHDIVKMQ